MARWPGPEIVYRTANDFRLRCLIDGRSLLWPNRSAWTVDNIDALISAIANDPGEGSLSFLGKLQAQVAGEADDVLRVAADALLFYLLFPSTIGSAKKRSNVQTIVDWRPSTLSLADSERQMRDDALGSTGIGNAGIDYLANQYKHIIFLLTFARGALSGHVNVTSAKACQDYINHLANQSDLRTNSRHVLLHLLFPDHFERIAIGEHKQRIVDAFSEDAGDRSDVDSALVLCYS